MVRVELEPAYVLHGRPYRESSLLLEAFSRGYGRVGLVARGARGARSSWKNMLQPFRPLLLSWNQRGELGTLTAADQVASPPAARGQALFCGLYVNELLVRALQRSDPHAELFDAYRQLLTELSTLPQPEPVLRVFEMRLLESLGLGMQLDTEHGSGLPLEAGATYAYHPELGAIRVDEATGLAATEQTGQHVSGAALLALRGKCIDDAHLRELKWLMRRLLRHHLGDKPLSSQALFQ